MVHRQSPRPLPLALGYVSLPKHVSAGSRGEAVSAAGRELAAFAWAEGYCLAEVYADVRGRTEAGLYALLETLRRTEATTAVVVADLDHLRDVGCLAGADLRAAGRYLRARLLAMNDDRPRPADPGPRPQARSTPGARPSTRRARPAAPAAGVR